MNGGMYLLRDHDHLVEMHVQAYDSEALLQELLATYPSLLAYDQIDPTSPRRWLLIAREALLPAEEDMARADGQPIMCSWTKKRFPPWWK
jgi:hypothetical protein